MLGSGGTVRRVVHSPGLRCGAWVWLRDCDPGRNVVVSIPNNEVTIATFVEFAKCSRPIIGCIGPFFIACCSVLDSNVADVARGDEGSCHAGVNEFDSERDILVGPAAPLCKIHLDSDRVPSRVGVQGRIASINSYDSRCTFGGNPAGRRSQGERLSIAATAVRVHIVERNCELVVSCTDLVGVVGYGVASWFFVG